MIYVIVGTSVTLRDEARAKLSKHGDVTSSIYSENIVMLEPLISAANLFGNPVIVELIQVMDVASSKNELVRLLPEMKKSPNIFIINEPFADAVRIKLVTKYSEEIFDGREEKNKGIGEREK